MHVLYPPAALYHIQTELSSRGNQAQIRKECEMKTFLDWQKAAEGRGKKREGKERKKRGKKREMKIKGGSASLKEDREGNKKVGERRKEDLH